MENIDYLLTVHRTKEGNAFIGFIKRSDERTIEKGWFELDASDGAAFPRLSISGEAYELLKKEQKLAEDFKNLFPQVA